MCFLIERVLLPLYRALHAGWTKLDYLKADCDKMLRLLRAIPTSLPPCVLLGVWDPGHGLGHGSEEGALGRARERERERKRERGREKRQIDGIGEVADALDLLARAHAREQFNAAAGRCYRLSV